MYKIVACDLDETLLRTEFLSTAAQLLKIKITSSCTSREYLLNWQKNFTGAV